MQTRAIGAGLERARQWFEAGQFERAVAEAARYLQQHPEDGRGWDLYGQTLFAQGARANAREALEQASLLRPLSANAQALLADCYLQDGSIESARAIYQHLVRQLGDVSGRLLPQVASGLGQLGEHRLALEVCREAARRDPHCDQAVFGVACYMAKCGYPAEWIVPLLYQAHQLAPRTLTYRLTLATLEQKLGRTDKAHELLAGFTADQLAAIECSGCLRRLGQVFQQAGDQDRWALCQQLLAERQP